MIMTHSLLKRTMITQIPTILNLLTPSIIQVPILVSHSGQKMSPSFSFNIHLVPYGGMATHSENRPGNEFYLHVDPSVEKDDQEDFELSNCK